MSERTSGIRPEEVARPAPAPRHIASGSGWEEWRGGGSVPPVNPWRSDPPYKNPATEGIGGAAERREAFQAPPGVTPR